MAWHWTLRMCVFVELRRFFFFSVSRCFCLLGPFKVKKCTTCAKLALQTCCELIFSGSCQR